MNMRTYIFPFLAITSLVLAASALAASYDEGLAAFKERNFTEARRLWSLGASQGDIDSEFQLGVMVAVGKHAPRDPELAKTLFSSASNKGNLDARIALALLHFTKDFDNHEEGLRLLRSAAGSGSKHAEMLIAFDERVGLVVMGIGGLALDQERLIPAKFSSRFSPDARTASAGKRTVEQVCAACHGTGVLGAPRIGYAAEWRDRLRVGLDTLAARSASGYKRCPPHGGDYMLEDDQLRAAIYFMTLSNEHSRP